MKTYDRYGDEIVEKEVLQTALDCLRERYGFNHNSRVYCSSNKKCVYKDDIPEDGRLRCMRLEYQV